MTDLSSRSKRSGVIETRQRTFQGMELREAPDGKGLTFNGYASVTEAPYEMEDWLGDYTEVVRKGAFGKTLAEGADVPFKVNHGGITLARTKSGTMRLSEDDTGLYVEADLDPTSPDVQSLRSAMERGDLDEMSFGFRVVRQEWSPDYSQRDITEVNLNKGDVSAVNYGANPATAGASLRGLGATPDELRDMLSQLRESAKSPSPAELENYALRARIANL
jgi:HK97 family phage prohead protease